MDTYDSVFANCLGNEEDEEQPLIISEPKKVSSAEFGYEIFKKGKPVKIIVLLRHFGFNPSDADEIVTRLLNDDHSPLCRDADCLDLTRKGKRLYQNMQTAYNESNGKMDRYVKIFLIGLLETVRKINKSKRFSYLEFFVRVGRSFLEEEDRLPFEAAIARIIEDDPSEMDLINSL